jgi:hypothetical protein
MPIPKTPLTPTLSPQAGRGRTPGLFSRLEQGSSFRDDDDDDVGAAPGQHAADRSGEPAALGRGFELGCGPPLRRRMEFPELKRAVRDQSDT